MLVGIYGKKRHGKDSLCEAIQKYLKDTDFDCIRKALADNVKWECAEMLWNQYANRYWFKYRSKSDLYKAMQDSKTKEQFRPFLQWLGTDFIREEQSNYWIELFTEDVDEYLGDIYPTEYTIIVPDIRFPNEADWIKSDPNNLLIKIVRPGMPDDDTHISETAMDDYDKFDIVLNCETLEAIDHAGEMIAKIIIGRLSEDLTSER